MCLSAVHVSAVDLNYRACQTLCSQGIKLTVYYTVEIALTTSSQFMTFTEPIHVLADFAP